jgi:hypothetical protein
MSLAHIGGLPLEEGLPAVAPVAGACALLVGTRLRWIGEWLRHR